MYCSKCGTQNPDDAAFCSNCGKDLKAGGSGPTTAGPSVPEVTFGAIPPGRATFEPATAFSNAFYLVKSPAAFMRQNKDIEVPLNMTMFRYVAVIAAIPFIATILGDLWYYSPRSYGYVIAIAIATYALDVIAVYVIGFLIWKLAAVFSTTTTQDRSTLLAALVYTPIFLVSIVDLVPFLSVLMVLGLLYGLYILYMGVPILLNTPQDKVLIYVVTTVVVAIVVYVIAGAILGTLGAAVLR